MITQTKHWSNAELMQLRAQIIALYQKKKGLIDHDTFNRVVATNKDRWSVSNPSVVLYITDTCLGIFPYRIALKYIKQTTQYAKFISSHPVNFKSVKEYETFLKKGKLTNG